MDLLFENFLFRPPKPSYTNKSFPGELCKLNGVLCLAMESKNPASHVIIYSHGNATDIGHCRDYLVILRDTLQMHVIALEYPGYGRRKGSPTIANLDQSITDVYTYVHSTLKWPAQSIIVMGRSIGTGPAVQLARTKKVGGLVLISPFTSIRAAAAVQVGKVSNLLGDRWRNLECISEVTCPVLFIHGACDKIIPVQHSIKLYRACPEKRKDISLLEFNGHNFLDWGSLTDALYRFFDVQGFYDYGQDQALLMIPCECYENWETKSHRAAMKKNTTFLALEETKNENFHDLEIIAGIGGNPEYEVSGLETTEDIFFFPSFKKPQFFSTNIMKPSLKKMEPPSPLCVKPSLRPPARS